ncbi:hypothetical protein, partial [Lentibacillus sediminis]|uniref:hypothetical protein n=1 Tax=Lentibacillus sediminis TaxID=1940529 RepID=UPI001958C0DC
KFSLSGGSFLSRAEVFSLGRKFSLSGGSFLSRAEVSARRSTPTPNTKTLLAKPAGLSHSLILF